MTKEERACLIEQQLTAVEDHLSEQGKDNEFIISIRDQFDRLGSLTDRQSERNETTGEDKLTPVLGFSVLIWDHFDGSFKKNARLYSPTWQRDPGFRFATENWWEYKSEEDIEEFIEKHRLTERFFGRFMILKERVITRRSLSENNASLGEVQT